MKTTKPKTQSIERINAAYAKASPAQRRKMIARDALKQLQAEKFTAVEGIWAHVFDKDDCMPGRHDPLQPVLLKKGTTCECCGAGAIFLSYVRLANNATYGDGDGLYSIQQKTDWPEDNMRLIELAFEGGTGLCRPHDTAEQAAVDFGFDYNSPTKRLNAILKNIAANKEGLFTP